jgi:adenosine deaminase
MTPLIVASEEHVRLLPKAELNCHVETGARPDTIIDLAEKNGTGTHGLLPACGGPYGSFGDFLDTFGAVCRSLVTADDFQRITYEGLADGAAAGVRYREMFFSPAFYLRHGVMLETAWAGIVQGISDAHADLDIHCRMILDLDWSADPALAMAMVEFATAQDRDLLVAIGAEGTSCGGDVEMLVPAFHEAALAGLHRTCHAGEEGTPDSIRIAIDDLVCERVDHAVNLFDDAQLTRRVIDQRIPVTVCPTSNVRIAAAYPDVESQPIRQQREAGVLVTLGVGDPALLAVDLADEYIAVQGAFGYGLDALEQISLDGVDASFAPRDEKASLRKRFIKEFNALRLRYRLVPCPIAL